MLTHDHLPSSDIGSASVYFPSIPIPAPSPCLPGTRFRIRMEMAANMHACTPDSSSIIGPAADLLAIGTIDAPSSSVSESIAASSQLIDHASSNSSDTRIDHTIRIQTIDTSQNFGQANTLSESSHQSTDGALNSNAAVNHHRQKSESITGATVDSLSAHELLFHDRVLQRIENLQSVVEKVHSVINTHQHTHLQPQQGESHSSSTKGTTSHQQPKIQSTLQPLDANREMSVSHVISSPHPSFRPIASSCDVLPKLEQVVLKARAEVRKITLPNRMRRAGKGNVNKQELLGTYQGANTLHAEHTRREQTPIEARKTSSISAAPTSRKQVQVPHRASIPRYTKIAINVPKNHPDAVAVESKSKSTRSEVNPRIDQTPVHIHYVLVKNKYIVSREEAAIMSAHEKHQPMSMPIRWLITKQQERGSKHPAMTDLFVVAKDIATLIHKRRGSIAKAIASFHPTKEKSRVRVYGCRSPGQRGTQLLTVLSMKGVKRLMNRSKYSRADQVYTWTTALAQQICDGIASHADSISRSSSSSLCRLHFSWDKRSADRSDKLEPEDVEVVTLERFNTRFMKPPEIPLPPRSDDGASSSEEEEEEEEEDELCDDGMEQQSNEGDQGFISDANDTKQDKRLRANVSTVTEECAKRGAADIRDRGHTRKRNESKLTPSNSPTSSAENAGQVKLQVDPDSMEKRRQQNERRRKRYRERTDQQQSNNHRQEQLDEGLIQKQANAASPAASGNNTTTVDEVNVTASNESMGTDLHSAKRSKREPVMFQFPANVAFEAPSSGGSTPDVSFTPNSRNIPCSSNSSAYTTPQWNSGSFHYPVFRSFPASNERTPPSSHPNSPSVTKHPRHLRVGSLSEAFDLSTIMQTNLDSPGKQFLSDNNPYQNQNQNQNYFDQSHHTVPLQDMTLRMSQPAKSGHQVLSSMLPIVSLNRGNINISQAAHAISPRIIPSQCASILSPLQSPSAMLISPSRSKTYSTNLSPRHIFNSDNLLQPTSSQSPLSTSSPFAASRRILSNPFVRMIGTAQIPYSPPFGSIFQNRQSFNQLVVEQGSHS